MRYEVGDLGELLSFFDKVPTGVLGIVIGVFEAPAGFYGLNYPEDYETNMEIVYRLFISTITNYNV